MPTYKALTILLIPIISLYILAFKRPCRDTKNTLITRFLEDIYEYELIPLVVLRVSYI